MRTELLGILLLGETTKIGSTKAMWTECGLCGNKTKTLFSRIMNNDYYKCYNCAGQPQGRTGRNRIYDTYKRNSIKNHREFNLTIDEFEKIVLQKCHYCGATPSNQVGNCRRKSNPWSVFSCNGIDRKDNNIGYTIENSLPCCKTCNLGKHTQTYEKYCTYLNDLIKYRGGMGDFKNA